jgi:hypothetical protein
LPLIRRCRLCADALDDESVVLLPTVRCELKSSFSDSAGATAGAGTPESFRNLLRSELVRWSRLIKDANIQMQ